jgi:F0F1-type ATP synthase membrane subunit b/b'
MSDALLTPIAVATGVVVIVVAIAIVLVVLIITVSMRGRQKRGATRRAENRQELAEANERAARAERDRDIAHEQAQQPNDRGDRPGA